MQMAIHYAASRGSMPALLMLLGWGASIDSLDAARNTPLHYAVAQVRPISVTHGLRGLQCGFRSALK